MTSRSADNITSVREGLTIPKVEVSLTSFNAAATGDAMTLSLAQINDVWNQNVVQVDEPVGEDYWQTPAETAHWGAGDCEDLAIAKYFSIAPWVRKTLHIVQLESGQHHVYCVALGQWVLDVSPHIHKLSDRPTGEILVKVLPLSGTDPRYDAMLARFSQNFDKNMQAVYTMLQRVQL